MQRGGCRFEPGRLQSIELGGRTPPGTAGCPEACESRCRKLKADGWKLKAPFFDKFIGERAGIEEPKSPSGILRSVARVAFRESLLKR